MKDLISLIYEDKNFLALYKPAGILVHPIEVKSQKSKVKDESTLVDWVLKRYPEIENVGDPSTGSGQAPSTLQQVQGRPERSRGATDSRLRQGFGGQAEQVPSTSTLAMSPSVLSPSVLSPSVLSPSVLSSGSKDSVPNGSGQVNLRPGIVHRLDKDTSGVILVARNQNYFNYLKNLFQIHQVKKTYLALVYGKLEPKLGIIKKPIRLKPGTIKRTVWRGKIEKEAITEYRVLKYLKYNKSLAKKLLYFSLLEVIPKTGRTHQIRVHLSSIGHPIIGDSLYGPKINPLGLKRQFLHAESLEFSLENGRRIKIESGLPEELKKIIFQLIKI